MLISLRIQEDLLAEIDAEALAEDRSRNSTIIRRLKGASHGNGRVDGADAGGKAGGSRDGTRLPVLPQAKGDKINVHPVQSMRNELVSGGQHLSGSAHEGHKTFRAGDGNWCSDCKQSF
jgi:hypothetical protein